MELGGKNSNIISNESVHAVGKVILTDKPDTSTILVRAYDNHQVLR
jgi:hypothetical protein